ncbi:hypothetical protein GFK26_24985 [Variovorax paradoxus]|uniref:Uncharacterized protein n=1 Tax=Variovorax paradoxus TaxID=34073 RepID=A0A5Q0M868_VARPD|nr:hypothetical protein [Variovorax paradoxus]QFZ85791.1 hypothetical protein GFK26_24985 [Variovorax paradoxus]
MKRTSADRRASRRSSKEISPCFSWQSDAEESTARFSLLMAVAVSLAALFIVTPVYLFGLGLASVASLAKGVNTFSSGVFADPMIWFPLFGTSGLAGLIVLVLASRKTIVAFRFDGKTEQLSYVEMAPLRKPRTTVVPFESIRSVTPTTLTANATVGHLSVVTRQPGRDEKSLWLGHRIPVVSLEEHSTWLSGYLGDRVQPLFRQDC